jgi:hypothetical protein
MAAQGGQGAGYHRCHQQQYDHGVIELAQEAHPGRRLFKLEFVRPVNVQSGAGYIRIEAIGAGFQFGEYFLNGKPVPEGTHMLFPGCYRINKG